MTAKHPRKKKFISREIQGRFVLTVIPYLILYTVIMLLVFMAPAAIALVTDVPLEEQEKAAQAFLMFHKSLWPAIFFSLSFIALHSILVSHKIAGPVYRFERKVQELTQGDVSRDVQLREGDYFQGLMTALNQMSTALKGELNFIREENSAACALSSRLIAELQEGRLSEEQIKARLEALAASQNRLQERLGKFRLE